MSIAARRRLFRTLGALGALLAAGQAEARDMRYCYAVDPSDRTIVFSEVFDGKADMEAIEKAFARALAANGQAYQAPSCPRSDDRAGAERDRSRAMDYNRSIGRKPVALDWRY